MFTHTHTNKHACVCFPCKKIMSESGSSEILVYFGSQHNTTPLILSHFENSKFWSHYEKKGVYLFVSFYQRLWFLETQNKNREVLKFDVLPLVSDKEKSLEIEIQHYFFNFKMIHVSPVIWCFSIPFSKRKMQWHHQVLLSSTKGFKQGCQSLTGLQCADWFYVAHYLLSTWWR